MSRKVWIVVAQLVTVCAVLLVWQLEGSQGDVAQFISSPTAVFWELVAWCRDPAIWLQVATTAEEAFFGFVLGVSAAILLGSLVGISRLWSRLLAPYVSTLNSIPKLALAPLFVMIFGLGITSKIYFVSIAVFFIPFYSVYGGFRALESLYLINAQVLGANLFWRIVDVYVPALVGTLIASLRVTISWSFLAAVLFETISSSSGIGYLIAEGQARLQNEVVLAGVALVSSIVIISDRLLLLIERRFASWKLA